jgi:hypothetical protein
MIGPLLSGQLLGRYLSELGLVSGNGIGHGAQAPLFGIPFRQRGVDPAAQRFGSAGSDSLVAGRYEL